MNAVIYARFSSNNQREESIEGQLKACYEYAEENNYFVIHEYIDRAQSGTSDKRANFQKMIDDSKKKNFEVVLVYQFDRFARNRYDSATYKQKLKVNGVKVISIKEPLISGPEAIMYESMLEGWAEYYSANLARSVTRGLKLNAEKGLYNGGYVWLGYKIEEDVNNRRKFVVDNNTAYIVRDIFNMYNNDHTMQEIADYLNSKGLRTTQGNLFRKSTISIILKNRRYTGIYIYKDIEIEGGMPRIIEDNIFNQAQQKLESIRRAPAKAKAKEEFVLTTKLYCGHCKKMMSGTSGTSQTGMLYRYYICNGVKEKKCNKKRVPKEYIENLVIDEIKKTLTKNNINKIAKNISKLCEQLEDSQRLKQLQNELKNNEQRKKKVLNRIIECEDENIRKSFYEEIAKLEIAKENIEKEIFEEQNSHFTLTEDDVICFFTRLRNENFKDVKFQRILINTLVDKIYLYDDHITIVYFAQNRKIKIDKQFIEQSESSFLEQLAQPIFNH